MITLKTKSSRFKMVSVKSADNIGIYNKFLNWVKGEFDLYLITEFEILKVYFPNGWFSIEKIDKENKEVTFEIRIEGTSQKACEILMNRLMCIYERVNHFK